MYVKPAEGRMPRCPRTGMRMPAEGARYSPYDVDVHILLRYGDVVHADDPNEAQKHSAQSEES